MKRNEMKKRIKISKNNNKISINSLYRAQSTFVRSKIRIIRKLIIYWNIGIYIRDIS